MYFLAVFLPLLGALIAGSLVFVNSDDAERQAKIDRASTYVTCGAMLLAAVAAAFAFFAIVIGKDTAPIELFTWIDSGSLEFSWELRADTLGSIMVLMVTVVSSMIHIYSIGYMSHDHSIPRFFSYLSFFTFFMLMLVSSNNLVQLFFGW